MPATKRHRSRSRRRSQASSEKLAVEGGSLRALASELERAQAGLVNVDDYFREQLVATDELKAGHAGDLAVLDAWAATAAQTAGQGAAAHTAADVGLVVRDVARAIDAFFARQTAESEQRTITAEEQSTSLKALIVDAEKTLLEADAASRAAAIATSTDATSAAGDAGGARAVFSGFSSHYNPSGLRISNADDVNPALSAKAVRLRTETQHALRFVGVLPLHASLFENEYASMTHDERRALANKVFMDKCAVPTFPFAERTLPVLTATELFETITKRRVYPDDLVRVSAQVADRMRAARTPTEVAALLKASKAKLDGLVARLPPSQRESFNARDLFASHVEDLTRYVAYGEHNGARGPLRADIVAAVCKLDCDAKLESVIKTRMELEELKGGHGQRKKKHQSKSREPKARK